MRQGGTGTAQGGRPAQTFHIMHGLTAGLGHGRPLPFFLTHFVDLVAKGGHPLVEGGLRRLGLTQHGSPHPLKQPGIPQGAPADHDTVTAGAFHHLHGALGGGDVAVGQYRDGHRPFHLGDGFHVHRRDVHLFPGAAVHHQKVGAIFLTGRSHPGTGQVFLVPADAHLDGERGIRAQSLSGGFDHGPAQIRVQHQFAARSAAGDFGRRTSHIDIQDIEFDALFPHNGNGMGQDLRLVAEQLDGIYPAGGIIPQKLHTFMIAEGDGLGTGHLADAPGRTVPHHKMPAGGVG